MDTQRDHQAIHLPARLSDEFGISQQVARTEIAFGTVTVDGKPWTGDPINLPREAVVGKTVVVAGQTRHFSFVVES